ncbi:P-loop containing nucleoside triphosphate hydrolase protein [Lojkania enalia]|uniref:P-loop containing nucleoside triphosphate hydrolase protein n=1 Tax=Lojkania enalia TaxID=147567 RepID=A0A9P4N3P2_9PLEO|nr:P-loop containing nucleoside triphosphate hydrolase protein [Didymosphaeria enalia]
MDSDDPPSEDFFYLLPPNIFGFHMLEKRWINLRVDSIDWVEWNTEAFESVAMDTEDKHMVKALVSTKLEEDRHTDVIEGKGNGLIILLHGGPGTGKTITAESVAEIARKPLYRVTCGDLGTDPEKVEEYLESVFYLGKIWDCVVLLDEADVFLETRSLANLQRNALVSVFLRVLEYYQGILILTSNRVGTFDEAFKSRIQLALHYRNLDDSQRSQIWSNFVKRLEHLNENADFADIRAHIPKLAMVPMNGRQIRNSISTARQLAIYEKEKMTSKHLERAIHVAEKFEKYLLEVKDNVGDDEWAREEGAR